MHNLKQIRNKLEQRRGRRKALQESIRANKKKLKDAKTRLKDIEQGKLILQEVAQQCQQELEYYISDIVTVALNTVFDDPYEFGVEFVARRGSTEADLFFIRNEDRINPIDESGVGAVDVAAFALRLAIWKMSDQYRNTILLDEPFKHLKGIEENRRVIQMTKLLSEKLDLQIIMISDERVPLSEIEKGADRVFQVSIKNRVSEVAVI